MSIFSKTGLFGKNRDAPPTDEPNIEENNPPEGEAYETDKIDDLLDSEDQNVVEVSSIAEEYGIRISSPQGYFPEDVDKILLDQKELINNLTNENNQLQKDLAEAQQSYKNIKEEFTKMKFELSFMEPPDLSTEQEFAMLGQMDSITGNYNNETVQELKDMQSQSQIQQQPKKPKVNLKLNV